MNDYLTQEPDPAPYDVNPDHEAEDVARDERREAFIAGLRDLADFLETHPAVDLPVYTTLNVFVDDRAALARHARAAAWEKVYNGPWFFLRKTFSEDLKLDITIERETVCRKVVTGTDVIPAQPERTVETIQWICDEPVLVLAGQ